ncbi:MAG: NAD-dependent epimerase/dehydratase family protein, partial [Solobacterium sp.]|nr:NAD-dependent epimerase/dehydratase family protein [Solobacterium sp.]
MTENQKGKTVLVTGAAGFIGAALSAAFLKDGRTERVIGLDNLNDYYDPALKRKRLELLSDPGFVFIHGDITDRDLLARLFAEYHPDIVVHMAAQAGVRYSLINPDAYISTNIIGFHCILEMCRQYGVQHFVFASSSSVYGDADHYPSAETDPTDKPRSLYAATKKADELIAYAYADMFGIPVTGLRF